MGVSTITYDVSLDGMHEHIVFTTTLLSVDPLGAPLVATWVALRVEWVTIDQTANGLEVTRLGAVALVKRCDQDLDDLARDFSKDLSKVTKGDHDDPLYRSYFGDLTLDELTRPMLGDQLATMRGWIPSLTASADPTLEPYAARLTALIQKTDDAVKARADAEEAVNDFRQRGARMAFYDKVNAARHLTWGQLGQAAKQPGVRVGPKFADRFFLKAKRPKVLGTADFDELIADNKTQLDTLTAGRATAKAREDAEAADKAAAATQKANLTAAKAAQKVADKKVRDLQKAGKGKKK